GPGPAAEPPLPEPPVARAPAGGRVPNFVVADLTGGEWEFRYAAGRLILMDFWGTTCGPCLRAMPGIKKLQADYGSSGLEIVAVACEAPAPFAARARDVEEVARKKELNYRVYLEREGKVGEIMRLFQVQWVPTLVLLDRQGTILWRGGATDADLTRLEGVVKETLTKR
ncbi:MAG TPA: TlpA disulfide reductase family protein, partial [Gemmataceae bacterium]|nr:TlpA disulfide reductase family protein [Gemmataceae bacterium]